MNEIQCDAFNRRIAALQHISAGQLLCMGLFTSDALSHWMSSVSLSHALVNNAANKELLLKVHLATSQGAPAVSLMQQAFAILQQGGGRVQSRLGVLILLSTWLAHCPAAVGHFLKLPNSIAFLTAQVGSSEHDELEVIVQSMCTFLLGLCVVFNSDSNAAYAFSRPSLCQLITKRIGVETFADKLAEVAKHEVYSKALKYAQVRMDSGQEILLDHEFCRLYKALEASLVKTVAPSSNQAKGGGGGDGGGGGSAGGGDSSGPSEAELKAQTAKYQDMIREQDDQIQHLRQRLAATDAQYIGAQSQLDELACQVQQLQDQNALLKAQRSNNVAIDHEPATGTYYFPRKSETNFR